MSDAAISGSLNSLLSALVSLQGVLRIHFLEALDLEGKDKFLGGLIKGKSDPYGVLQIGSQIFQSKTVKESLHPKWNEVFEVMSLERGVKTIYLILSPMNEASDYSTLLLVSVGYSARSLHFFIYYLNRSVFSNIAFKYCLY